MLLKGRLDSVTGTKIITEDLVIWGETWSVVYNGEMGAHSTTNGNTGLKPRPQQRPKGLLSNELLASPIKSLFG